MWMRAGRANHQRLPATKSSAWLAWGALARIKQWQLSAASGTARLPSALSSTRAAAITTHLHQRMLIWPVARQPVRRLPATSFPGRFGGLRRNVGNNGRQSVHGPRACGRLDLPIHRDQGILTVPPMAIDLEGAAVAESTATGDLSPHRSPGSRSGSFSGGGALAP